MQANDAGFEWWHNVPHKKIPFYSKEYFELTAS